ncbi:hypothetical protein K0M31_009620 [Melipona bicolor]|uniref:Vitellogenin domain-containing protein n=1 Tax=Melipona bicolor TaxID=60889 RepID=A0AA40FNI8_9HYME|nr:hypothetical protein K0M31_009620 [Melipona bicolor]
MINVTVEPTFHMKMVYMMAMKNVRMSHVLKHLEPIISGKEVVSKKPYNIRVQAIWIVKHINVGLHYTHDLLWPVLSDVSLPTVVRVAAFDVLVHQVTHLGRFMNIYWLMVDEKDEHLYNYYVDTIKGLANSVDPCLMKTREICKKVLKFISKRNVDGPLSRKIHVDYEDKKYGYAESVKTSLVLDSTGFPYVGSVEHVETVTRKPVHKWGVSVFILYYKFKKYYLNLF